MRIADCGLEKGRGVFRIADLTQSELSFTCNPDDLAPFSNPQSAIRIPQFSFNPQSEISFTVPGRLALPSSSRMH
jgi:hypothetical protein